MLEKYCIIFNLEELKQNKKKIVEINKNINIHWYAIAGTRRKAKLLQKN